MNQSKAIAHISEDGRCQTLEDHLKGVSKLSTSFAAKIGLPSLGELIGLLHDFGKYSNAFQAYLMSAAGKLNPDDDEHVDVRKMKGKIDHSSAGAQHLWETLHNKKDQLVSLAGQIMSLCIASHHSGLIDCLSPDGTDSFGNRIAKSRDRTHLDEVRIKVDEPIQGRVDKLLTSSSMEHELRLRLESLFNGEKSREIREFALGLLVRYLFSALIDADRLDSAQRELTAAPEWAYLTKRFETYLPTLTSRNKVDKIRNEVSSSCLHFSRREKGLFQLTVPTGGGKTLASLRFALHHAEHHQMDHIIYVVPYTTIIDQNADKVRSILESSDDLSEMKGKQVVLEHHSNLTPETDTWQTKILSENWDAPIVFTTAVQFLETLFSAGTRGARRMHQLANAVIIFDEIQSLPVRTIHLFNNAINFLVGQCGSTVVFCTATQPLLSDVDASKGAANLSKNHQMVPDTKRLFGDLRRVDVLDERKAGGWTENEVANAALEEMSRAGSVLIIVNTKAQAREIYNRCRGMTEQIFHLSTSMCPAHRVQVLRKIKDSLESDDPRPLICVSTQLIEAGVDVDFGSVIRYMAGLDSIAQAAGRCNRNGLRSSGKVVIVNPAKENLDKLPDIRMAKDKAERVLNEFRVDPAVFDHDLLGPSAMTRYYQYHFFDRAHEMTYPVSPDKVGRNDSIFSLLSTNGLSVSAYKRANKAVPPFYLRQSFQSAGKAFEVISTPTKGVIVPYGEEGKHIISKLSASYQMEKEYDLLKQAQRFSVNLFPYELESLRERRRIYEVQEGSGILYLDSRHYSNEFGASLEQVSEMEMLFG